MSGLARLIADLSADKRALLELLLAEETVEISRPAIVPRSWGSTDAHLSFAQRRLWLIDRMEPGSAAYAMPFAFRLAGRLDLPALECAAGEIVRRHEVLRTTFPSRADGEPVQRVGTPGRVALPLVDLRALAAEARESEARRLAEVEAACPFALAAGPLLRLRVVRLAAEDHLVLANMHHIVSDGWSIGLFVREMTALYTAFTAGHPSPFVPLPIQYRDFAEWQTDWLGGERLEAEVGYWRQRLAGAPPRLELPTDRPRSAARTSRAGSVRLEVEKGTVLALRRLAGEEGTTLFAVLLAAFQAILLRHSGQEDVVLGVPSAGRDRLETEELIGFFVQTLVMRTDLAGDPSFRELLRRVREVVLGAHSHRDLPFEVLVEALRPERSPLQAPVFQVMFSLENTPREDPRLPGLVLQSVEVESPTAKFDLTVTVWERAGGDLHAGFIYNRDLFDRTTMGRLAGHLARLLGSAAVRPGARISELPCLTAAERQQLVGDWNATAVDYPRRSTIYRLFAQQAAASPGSTALRLGAAAVSYGELERQANRLARYLRGLGVEPGSRVGLCLERSVEAVTVLLGILAAGGAYVPLDPGYPPQRLRWLIEDSGIGWLLTRTGLLQDLGETRCAVVRLDRVGEDLSSLPASDPGVEVSAEDLAYVLYTSGSTGTPKAVGVTHRNVVRLVKEASFAHLGSGEVFLLMAPLSFDASTLELWAPLLNGGTLAILPPGNPSLEELEEALARYGVTALWLTAGLFHLVVDERVGALRTVRQLMAGGDVLSPAHVSRALRELPSVCLINGYGPTENTTFTCTHAMSGEARAEGSIPIGRPISNTSVYVLDRRLRLAPAGVGGELYAGGDGVARGYLGRPELTAERFIPDPFATEPGSRLYRTGDLARWRADGLVEFLGRRDGQVKLRGFRIEIGEIESALTALAAVRDAVVMAREDTPGDKRLVAYVVPEPGGSVSARDIATELASRLPEPMVPSVIVVLDELPLTPSGKVDRRALPAPEALAAEEGAAARTPVEEILAGIFAEVLGRESLGVEENFFALGGHSLKATQVVSRVRQIFAVELPLRRLFETPTVAGLAATVEEARRAGLELTAPPLVAVSRAELLPLSFAQQRLWFVDRLEPGSAAYNIPAAWRLTGDLDEAALAGSLRGIVRRHEVLRTRFGRADGEAFQIVDPDCGLPLPRVDLGGLPPEAGERELRRLATAEARRPFDLERDWMLRATLVRLGPGEHAALFTVHHIAGDGWSLEVFARELGEQYAALQERREPRLPELPVQYADYAAWQRRWLAGDTLAAELAWWRRHLAALPPVLELPIDRPRPPVQSFRGATESAALAAELAAALRTLGRRQGATLFMTLLAAFEALLYRYSGQEAFAVGTPIAGRTRVEVEPLIGCFVNTLVLPARIVAAESFLKHLSRVRESSLEAHAHQEIPFERLVEELQPERSLAYSPLFQVLLAFQNAARPGKGLPGLSLAPLAQETGTSKFDLSLVVSEPSPEMAASFEYASDLFERATVRRMLEHLGRLLAAAAADPEQAIEDLPLLSAAEREEVLVAGNDTAVEAAHDLPVHRLVAARAAEMPDALAVAAERENLSFGALDLRANRLAWRLRRLGVGPETRVGIFAGRSLELVVGLLAVLKAGGAYVPIDPAYPPERVDFFLRDSRATVLLTLRGLAGRLPESPVPVLVLDDPHAGESERAPAVSSAASNLAYVIYTSGSTGTPKGVEIEHGGLLNLVLWHQRTYGVDPADRATLLASPSFDASVWEVWPYLTAGASLHIPSDEVRADPARLLRYLAAERITLAFLATPLAEAALAAPWPAGLALRAVLTGGAALQSRPPPGLPFTLVNHYGPTESSVVTTCAPVTPEGAGKPPIGRPIDNTRAYVLDRVLQAVPAGIPGELFIGSLGLARGYLGRPALTASRFLPDPFGGAAGGRLYRTGDLVRRRPDGDLEFLGRLDQQVKLRGIRVELGEIEGALESLPEVRSAAVAIRQDPPGGERLVAYVVAVPGAAAALLRTALRVKLPEYMVPADFVLLADLPLTPNGKLDRRALPALAPDRPPLAGHLPPRDELELALLRIWEEVLGVPAGVTDGFFDLGGHSLLAVRLLSRIEERLGAELPLATLFEGGTIERQAALLRRRKPAGRPAGAAHAVAVQASGAGRPFFCVHPVGGNVLCYFALARRLDAGSGHPFWAFQSSGEGEPSDIESMAARYVAELGAVQPSGPCFVGGWSMGALVAFEMARRLSREGREVAVLALLDPPLPAPAEEMAAAGEADLLAAFGRDLAGLSGAAVAAEVRGLSGEQALDALFARAGGRLLPPGSDPAVLRRLFAVFRANVEAMRAYRPKGYDGKIDLFLTDGRGDGPVRGWSALAAGGVEVHAVPGDHYSMLREPGVERLAERLAAVLATAERRREPRNLELQEVSWR